MKWPREGWVQDQGVRVPEGMGRMDPVETREREVCVNQDTQR